MKPEECECKYLTKLKMKEEWRGQSMVLGQARPDSPGYVCRHPSRRRRVKSPCLPLSDLPCPISLSLSFFPD